MWMTRCNYYIAVKKHMVTLVNHTQARYPNADEHVQDLLRHLDIYHAHQTPTHHTLLRSFRKWWETTKKWQTSRGSWASMPPTNAPQNAHICASPKYMCYISNKSLQICNLVLWDTQMHCMGMTVPYSFSRDEFASTRQQVQTFWPTLKVLHQIQSNFFKQHGACRNSRLASARDLWLHTVVID